MGIDFMCLTETWQVSNEFIKLNEAIPHGYEFIDKPRLPGRGKVLYRSCFKVVSVPLQDFSSFECLALKFTGSLPLFILLIDRPPKASSVFINEFAELLSSVCPILIYPCSG